MINSTGTLRFVCGNEWDLEVVDVGLENKAMVVIIGHLDLRSHQRGVPVDISFVH